MKFLSLFLLFSSLSANAATSNIQFLGGGVTSVTGTTPVVSTGGTTPAISMPASTDSVNGYMSAADHTLLSGRAARTYVDANFLDLTSSQSVVSGTKTFASTINLSGLTASFPVKLDSAKNLVTGKLDLSNTLEITGNLPVARLNNGTGADSSTFWRGDGSWAAAGGGSGTAYIWSGYISRDQNFDLGTPATGFQNFNVNNSASLTQVQNENFGTVTIYNSSGNLPGIVFTCPATKKYAYWISSSAACNGTNNRNYNIRATTDGSTTNGFSGGRCVSTSTQDAETFTVQGIVSCTSAATVNLWLQEDTINSGGPDANLNGQGNTGVEFLIHNIN